jgi:hypothetical protein
VPRGCGLSAAILKILLTSSDRSPSTKEYISAFQSVAYAALHSQLLIFNFQFLITLKHNQPKY